MWISSQCLTQLEAHSIDRWISKHRHQHYRLAFKIVFQKTIFSYIQKLKLVLYVSHEAYSLNRKTVFQTCLRPKRRVFFPLGCVYRMHLLNKCVYIFIYLLFLFFLNGCSFFNFFLLNQAQTNISFLLPVWAVSCIDSYSEWSRAKGFISVWSDTETAGDGSCSSVSTAFWCFLSLSPLASSPAVEITEVTYSKIFLPSTVTS